LNSNEMISPVHGSLKRYELYSLTYCQCVLT
jgi:hypothetical protein